MQTGTSCIHPMACWLLIFWDFVRHLLRFACFWAWVGGIEIYNEKRNVRLTTAQDTVWLWHALAWNWRGNLHRIMHSKVCAMTVNHGKFPSCGEKGDIAKWENCHWRVWECPSCYFQSIMPYTAQCIHSTKYVHCTPQISWHAMITTACANVKLL